MERETGFEPATSSLGSRVSFENKEQMRPGRCILTTANHREIKRSFKKLEIGVNGVKSRASISSSLRHQLKPPPGSLNRLFSTLPEAIRVTSKFYFKTPT